MYTLKKEIPLDKLNNYGLSRNIKSPDFLNLNPHLIDINGLACNENGLHLFDFSSISYACTLLSSNPSAYHFLKNNLDKIWCSALSRNPSQYCLDLLNKTPSKKIDWDYISENPFGISLLRENPSKINFIYLAKNPNPEAISIIEENLFRTDIKWGHVFSVLSRNTNAMHLLKQYPHRICWEGLSSNTNPEAIKMIENNLDKANLFFLSQNPSSVHIFEKYPHLINWKGLSGNPNAYHILVNNLHRDDIDWIDISDNPSIFELDYDYLKKRIQPIAEEIAMKVFHPSKYKTFSSLGYDGLDEEDIDIEENN